MPCCSGPAPNTASTCTGARWGDRISAVIYVARDSQKGILIGHKGEKLKKVGQQAREDMEQFLGKKVFLQLYVKVNENWRDNERQLKRFGYEQE